VSRNSLIVKSFALGKTQIACYTSDYHLGTSFFFKETHLDRSVSFYLENRSTEISSKSINLWMVCRPNLTRFSKCL